MAFSSRAAGALAAVAALAIGGGLAGLATRAVAADSAPAAGTGAVKGKLSLVRLSVGSAVDGFGEVLVYVDDAPPSGAPPATPFVMAQEKKKFVPGFLVVPKGSRVDFPNRDLVFHNVFSVTPGSTFDLGLYKSGTSKSVLFDKPGIVSVYCNIHPQMAAYVAVMANPLFARPAGDGGFAIPAVPAGTWHLTAWFPHGKSVRNEIRVEAGKTLDVAITLSEVRGATRHADKEGKAYGGY